MNKKLHTEVLPETQKKVFDILVNIDWINSFYLAGGTGLALQIGHRESYDFEIFTEEKFDSSFVLNEIKKIGRVGLISRTDNILHCMLDDMEISFFKVPYSLIQEPVVYHKLKIASTLDIFLMKMQAISGRGSKKDFIDLYFLLKLYELDSVSVFYNKKYGIYLQSDYHLHKALVYFNDAEGYPMPKMFIETEWNEIKKSIVQKVRDFSKRMKFLT